MTHACQVQRGQKGNMSECTEASLILVAIKVTLVLVLKKQLKF